LMQIVFRTDASVTIGTGHVMRCLTLASALRERGAVVAFVSRAHDGNLCDLIAQRGFLITRLPSPDAGFQVEHNLAHAASLGSTWQEDAAQTRAAIEGLGLKPDWLVVDHYAVDQRWESVLRTSAGRIMVIDDLANRMHHCDLLLDQNLVTERHARYRGKVPTNCIMLLGLKYALLQPIYAQLHDHMLPRTGPIRHIFIFFGGADSDNLTGRTLAAFLRLQRPEIEVNVVIAAGSSHAKNIRQQVAGHSNIHLHSGLPSLAPLMAKADLAVGAGGATSWERLCVGLPSLVVTLAEHQRQVAAYLHAKGLILWIGDKEQADQQAIADTLERALNMDSLEDWSSRCLQTCAGRGVYKVLNSMIGAI
jgi:UDP-2,4-diacetamido-2,4,6-trideoxy-beta-L-altropyranose hydrolase